MPTLPSTTNILVIGTGNAGLSAALSACETNPHLQVTIIDKSPASFAGGNSYFTAGAFRTVHGGLDDLLPLLVNSTTNSISPDQVSRIDMSIYSATDFATDLRRMTNGRSDKELSSILVSDSRDTVGWLADHEVRFQLSFNRQSYEVDGRIKFWGGLALKTEDGGKRLIEDELAAVKKCGVGVFFDTAVTRLVACPDTGAVVGVEVVTAAPPKGDGGGEGDDGDRKGTLWQKKFIKTGAVILAAGGFEANPQLRAQYLGPGWDAAHVRGTPYNTGEVLQIAQRDVFAQAAGNWSGCHSVAWDADAPTHGGDRCISNEFTKSGYPLGIMVNCDGIRFVDEGADLRNYTYAMMGRRILQQPSQIAFQVWDARTIPWLREEEYRPEVVRRIMADSLEELAERCKEVGLVDPERFLDTLEEYNRSVASTDPTVMSKKWDPAVKDGLGTKGLNVPKSNWALPIDSPPFLAVRVTAGITFTFGGLAVEPQTAAVRSAITGAEVPGLYCAGEMLGGIFYDNYPGGSGLTAGAVFGRRAGRAAAEWAGRGLGK